MSKKKIVQLAVLAVTAATSVLACLLLPDTIAVQWNSGGPSSYMSKYLAAACSVIVCLLLDYSWNTKSKRNPGTSDTVMGIFSCLGIAMNIGFILLN